MHVSSNPAFWYATRASGIAAYAILSAAHPGDTVVVGATSHTGRMTDLQGGQVQLMCDQTTQTTQLINTGRIKAYGVTTKQKVSSLPNLATLDSQGLKDFDLAVWHGLYAPKGTPKAATDKLNAALQAALKDPAFRDAMDKLGAIVVPPAKQTPDGLKTFLKAEIDKWSPIIKKAGQYAD